MFLPPTLDVYTGRIYSSELQAAANIFNRNGFRIIDIRACNSASEKEATYWVTSIRIRDAVSFAMHEQEDLNALTGTITQHRINPDPDRPPLDLFSYLPQSDLSKLDEPNSLSEDSDVEKL